MATGWHSISGTFNPSSNPTTITHNLGFIPDIFCVVKTGSFKQVTSYRYIYMTGYSDRLIQMLTDNDGRVSAGYSQAIRYNSSTQLYDVLSYTASNIESSEGSGFGVLRDCTETTIVAGAAGSGGLILNEDYTWTAMWCDGELYGDGSVPTPLMLTSSINRGGYQIVDLANNEFVTGTAIQIPGIYALVDSNSKAVLLSGINIDGKTYNDLYVSMYKVDFKYTAKVYGKYIVIDENDNVIFQNDELTTTYIESEEDE